MFFKKKPQARNIKMPANLNRKQQREIKAVVERAKKDNGIPQTAQQSIPFQRMFPDGICRVTDSYYTISIAGCAIVIITLALLQRLVRVNSVKHVEIKFIHRVETIAFINDYFQTIGVRVLDIDFHVENKGKYNLYTNIYTLDMQGKTTYKDIVNKLSEYANIQGIRTRNT